MSKISTARSAIAWTPSVPRLCAVLLHVLKLPDPERAGRIGEFYDVIAAELNVSMGTVKSHLSSIYWKLGVSNRTQAGLVGLGIFPMLGALAS